MITIGEAVHATGGTWLAQPLPEETPLRGAAFDTRALGKAAIFCALVGEAGDGHTYLDQLAGSGIRLAVVGREVTVPGFGGAVLRVADTLQALADLARYALRKHRPTVVAVTGSYGKTTAKEVIAHVLAGGLRVLKSPGSLNNEIGIPVALLGLDGTEDAVVLEFSARKPGDIEYLGSIAPPDVAVLLAVGHAHIGVFGSREAIYETKGEIFAHLRDGGLAVVGAHDPRLRELAGKRRTVTFGAEAGDYRAEAIGYDDEGCQTFTGVNGDTRLALHAGMPGPHGCEPVLAAWAVARELGVSDDVVAARSGVAPAQKGRAVVLSAPGGATLVDDCYNASPETVINLLGILQRRPEPEKVLVLGPLAELEAGFGTTAEQIAPHLGEPLARCILYEPRAAGLGDSLSAALGAEADGRLFRVRSQGELIDLLRGLDEPGRVIGLKGARSAHMERFVQALLGVPVACERQPCGLLKYCTDCDLLAAP